MEVDYFKDIAVPVIGGLGLFMLGLEFMTDGIPAMAANRMRSLLAKIAGMPIKGMIFGGVAALLGPLRTLHASTERAFDLIRRIVEERNSVDRDAAASAKTAATIVANPGAGAALA